jgi:hypothetical protein
MPHLNKDKRNQAEGMLRVGLSIQNNVNHFNCHHKAIVRLNQRFLPQIPYLTGSNQVHQELPLCSRTALLHFSVLGIVSL